MVVFYEGRNYYFSTNWKEQGTNTSCSEVLSNFLSQKAVEDGADIKIFASVYTAKRYEIFEDGFQQRKKNKKKVVEVKQETLEVIGE